MLLFKYNFKDEGNTKIEDSNEIVYKQIIISYEEMYQQSFGKSYFWKR
jgi:hypothetical protein